MVPAHFYALNAMQLFLQNRDFLDHNCLEFFFVTFRFIWVKQNNLLHAKPVKNLPSNRNFMGSHASEFHAMVLFHSQPRGGAGVFFFFPFFLEITNVNLWQEGHFMKPLSWIQQLLMLIVVFKIQSSGISFK